MSNSKKRSEVTPINPVIEVSIFKHFPFLDFLLFVLFFGFLIFFVHIVRWIVTLGSESFSFFFLFFGMFAGFILHVPAFLSAQIMNVINKPILRFDSQGFYYTPQIWSMSRLYKWDNIVDIKTKYSRDILTDSYKCIIQVYFKNGSRASLNAKIMPISYKKILRIFKYCLKNKSKPLKRLKG